MAQRKIEENLKKDAIHLLCPSFFGGLQKIPKVDITVDFAVGFLPINSPKSELEHSF